MTNCAVATGVSVTAVGSAETAGVRVGAGAAVAAAVVPNGATASEACVGTGVEVDMGAEGTAVGGVGPAHAVRTNSVRKTNPPCWSFLYGPMGILLLDGCQPELCQECNAPVHHYDPDGAPYCETHGPGL